MPNVGDELHHFGWNACSSALCPWAPHPHVERRYLLVPGLRSSRIHVVDVKDDPRNPKLTKVIEAEELHHAPATAARTPSTAGPTASTSPRSATRRATGRAASSCSTTTTSPHGRWEADRGPQELAYDFWWHLGYDTLITSEWGTPNMVEDGLIPELLLGNQYGHQLHVWDLDAAPHAGDRPRRRAPDGPRAAPRARPAKPYGFVGVVVSTADLSASVWLWRRQDDGSVGVEKVITIPAEPAEPDQLPAALQPFGAVPPLITDIALCVDDRSLFVSCWGTGELKRYDVTTPAARARPAPCASAGSSSARRTPPSGPLNGGPQMVEISRDGKRVYLTNSLYAAWDAQFYPEGIDGWMVKLDANGSLELDPDFFVEFNGERPHQVRLQGGDASSDSYCFPS